MEKGEISIHEAKVYQALRARADAWVSNGDLAAAVPGVSARTVRYHTKRFVELGLLDVAEVFPSHRYRWSEFAEKRNAGYLKRLSHAAEVFGLEVAS